MILVRSSKNKEQHLQHSFSGLSCFLFHFMTLCFLHWLFLCNTQMKDKLHLKTLITYQKKNGNIKVFWRTHSSNDRYSNAYVTLLVISPLSFSAWLLSWDSKSSNATWCDIQLSSWDFSAPRPEYYEQHNSWLSLISIFFTEIQINALTLVYMQMNFKSSWREWYPGINVCYTVVKLKGGKFLMKLWLCIDGGYYKIIWLN